MLNKLSILGLGGLISLILFSGCAVEKVQEYVPSYYNKHILYQAQPHHYKVNVMSFSSNVKGSSLVCRSGQPIQLIPGQTFRSYIHGALVNELKAAQLYSSRSSHYLVGRIDKISFNAGAFNQAYWDLQITFWGQSKKPFVIKNQYVFNTNVNDPNYCEQVREAFPSAVRELNRILFENNGFLRLIGAPESKVTLTY